MGIKVGESKTYLNKEMKNPSMPFYQGVAKIDGKLYFHKVYLNKTKAGKSCLGHTFEEYDARKAKKEENS